METGHAFKEDNGEELEKKNHYNYRSKRLRYLESLKPNLKTYL